MALGVNVKKRRLQLGLTQGELAEMIGVSQVAIANLEKRDSRSSRNLVALADALQCSARELESGVAINESAVAYQAKPLIASVPVLQSSQILAWPQKVKTSTSIVPRIGGGVNAYCFAVEGDSMTAPIGVKPSFPDGYLIHVDPDLTAKHNDYIVADIGNGQIAFKQLKFEDGREYLKSINPEFGMVFENFDIMAVVIGASLHL
ncbi:MAG: LexA family protein [Arenicella sp.]